MHLLARFTLAATSLLFLCGCQVGYLIENGYHQADLLLSREPIDEALNNPEIDEKTKKKLELAVRAKQFAETELGLVKSDNYTSFVQLDGKYVVHSLTVAPRNQLKLHRWSFPFFGSFPYLGYFNKKSAELAEKKYKEEGFDTSLRGVTAFSTLGWFEDPILSSMVRYSDYNLVNVIIHETVHATIYIKDHIDFNERLATFIGNVGTEIFYKKEEGKNSKTLKKAQDANHDDEVFSEFISTEIKSLKEWYKNQKGPIEEPVRKERFEEIKRSFTKNALPKMKTRNYTRFAKADINNAKLLSLHMYYKDMSDFEKAYKKLGKDFSKLIAYSKTLEDSKDPEADLKKFANE